MDENNKNLQPLNEVSTELQQTNGNNNPPAVVPPEPPRSLPWKRMPGEPDKASFAFEYYLYSGYNRTFVAAAKCSGLSLRTVKNYAKKWQWIYRASQYDRLQIELLRDSKLLDQEKRNQNITRARIESSRLLSSLIHETNLILENYHGHVRNPNTEEKLKFFRDITRTLDKLYKSAEIKFDSALLGRQSERDIKINNMFNLNNDVTNIKFEKEYACNTIMKEPECLLIPTQESLPPNPEPDSVPDILEVLLVNVPVENNLEEPGVVVKKNKISSTKSDIDNNHDQNSDSKQDSDSPEMDPREDAYYNKYIKPLEDKQKREKFDPLFF